MFGESRWSKKRRMVYHLTSPLTAPLAVAGLAVALPISMVVLPVAVAIDDWRDTTHHHLSKPKRYPTFFS